MAKCKPWLYRLKSLSRCFTMLILVWVGCRYITGGKNSKNRAVATSAYYDPVRKDITVTTDLQIPRFGHGLVELDGYIYAVGGYGDDGGRVDSVVSQPVLHFCSLSLSSLTR